MPGKEGCLCEILHGKREGIREGLDKGSAAGGTGFIEKHIVDRMVLDADALHVLAAYVEDAIHFGIKEGGSVIVGDGFNLTFIQHESGFQQSFSVTGRTAADDLRVRGEQAVKLRHRSDGSPDRAAVIIAVKRIKKGSVFTDQGELGSGGSGIDSQEAFSVIPGKIRPLHARLFMTAAEFVILLLRGEERIHAPDLKLHVKFAGEPFGHTGQRHKDVFLRVHGTAHGGEQVGIVHIDRMLVIELQGAYKRFFELGEEVQRSAQKSDMTPDGLAAGQSADGLIDHCLKNRGGQVLLGGSFIDQGLDIGFGENTAAGRDRIKGAVSAGIGIEPRRIGLQEACHLIDE